jgi:hypothetical protein
MRPGEPAEEVMGNCNSGLSVIALIRGMICAVRALASVICVWPGRDLPSGDRILLKEIRWKHERQTPKLMSNCLK